MKQEKAQIILDADVTGLSSQEVGERQAKGLTNAVQDKVTKTNAQIIKEHLCTLFNFFNFIIGICLILVGAYANLVYLLIVLSNISVGIVQEIHAKKMVENLSLIAATKSVVIRDGQLQEIAVEDIVLDDMTLLSMGSQVCSDSVVVKGQIEVNESLLTGEADPILKRSGDHLLSGSFVISGKGYAQVEHVGADNFASQISGSAKVVKRSHSELLNSMRKVTKFTSYFIVPIGVILFLEAFLMRGDSTYTSVVSTAAALLGMLPKGLVLLISMTLVIGIIKLSGKKVLVQDLYALETLARVDTICLDKTGTITEGNMQVSQIYPVGDTLLPFGAEQAISLFINAMEDNNATFQAIIDKFPAGTGDLHASYQAEMTIPFSSERKWSAAMFKDLGTLVLGAPEKVIPNQMDLLPQEARNAQELGKRILCLGYSKEPIDQRVLPSLNLIAVVELSDPIRRAAPETLQFFREEGVDVRIISGDNPLTVSSIARQAGLSDYDSCIDMSAVETDEALKEAARHYRVFGRVSPAQKKDIIKALKEEGRTVAMTGDGVNDVLALKEADCSIAMAAGSHAARQVSKMILLNSSFTAIPDMIMEGRRVVNNITRFGGVFLVKTIYSILLAIFSAVTMTAFPFVPIQITLYDGIIEGYPSFFLSLEPSKKRVEGNFLRDVIGRAAPFALLVLLNVLVVTFAAPKSGLSSDETITVMYLLTSLCGLLSVFKACWPFNKVRAFVCITSMIGFFLASYLFSGILYLEHLNSTSLLLFSILAAICIPAGFFLSLISRRLFKSKNKG